MSKNVEAARESAKMLDFLIITTNSYLGRAPGVVRLLRTLVGPDPRSRSLLRICPHEGFCPLENRKFHKRYNMISALIDTESPQVPDDNQRRPKRPLYARLADMTLVNIYNILACQARL